MEDYRQQHYMTPHDGPHKPQLPPPQPDQLIAITGYPPPVARPRSQPQTVRQDTTTPFGDYSGSGPPVPSPHPPPPPPIQYQQRRFPQNSRIVKDPPQHMPPPPRPLTTVPGPHQPQYPPQPHRPPVAPPGYLRHHHPQQQPPPQYYHHHVPPPAHGVPGRRPHSTQPPPAPKFGPPSQPEPPVVAPPGTINPSDLQQPGLAAAQNHPGPPARPVSNPTKSSLSSSQQLEPHPLEVIDLTSDSPATLPLSRTDQTTRPPLPLENTLLNTPVFFQNPHHRNQYQQQQQQQQRQQQKQQQHQRPPFIVPNYLLAGPGGGGGGGGGDDVIPQFFVPCDFCAWLKAKTGRGGQCFPSFPLPFADGAEDGREGFVAPRAAKQFARPIRRKCTTCHGFGERCTVGNVEDAPAREAEYMANTLVRDLLPAAAAAAAAEAAIATTAETDTAEEQNK